MANKFHILDIEVSSQPWAHKIETDITFAPYQRQKNNHTNLSIFSCQPKKSFHNSRKR